MKLSSKSAIILNIIKEGKMPDYILCDDMIEEMVEELSYIKLKTAIELEKKR